MKVKRLINYLYVYKFRKIYSDFDKVNAYLFELLWWLKIIYVEKTNDSICIWQYGISLKKPFIFKKTHIRFIKKPFT